MNYAELLMDEKWQEKRQGIIKRDNNCCQECNNISQLPELEYSVFHSVNYQENIVFILIKGGSNLYFNTLYINSLWVCKSLGIRIGHQLDNLINIESFGYKRYHESLIQFN